MVEINGTPFLDILINYVAGYGFQRFILCTGYLGEVIENHYQVKEGALRFVFSKEAEALGTGGAIKNVESFLQSEIFLVLNGDSFCKINLRDFFSFHTRKKATISIALTTVEQPLDYGTVKLNEDQQIISFNEKTSVNGTNLINAGVYIFDRTILRQMPADKKFSLEYDFFPSILDKGVYGYVTAERLLDIGTPERLEQARQYFSLSSKQKGANL